MRPMMLLMVVLLPLVAGAQQAVEVAPWRATVGKIGPDAITYGGQPLARDFRVQGFLPGWKGTRFHMGEARVETHATGATWTREVPDNQQATLALLLQGQTCRLNCDTVVDAAGPTEVSLVLEPAALATSPDVAHIVVDGKPQMLDLRGKFPHVNIVREIRFEQPERSIVIRAEGFHIQDRRDRNAGFFLVVALASEGQAEVAYRKGIEITVEPAAPETIAARRAFLSQSEYDRTDLPVPNGGFEDEKLSRWSENPRAAVDTEIKHAGQQSARITIPPTQTDRTGIYLTQNIPAQAGRMYQATAWVRAQDVKAVALGDMSPTGVTIILEFADKDGKWLASGDYADGLYGTKDWSQISTSACRAPEGAGYAIIFLSLRGTGTGWFDDIQLAEIQQHVVLQEPGDQATVADNTPRFAWAINTPGTMTLELSPTPDFPADRTLRFADLREKSYAPEKPLAPGQWHWRVLAPASQASSAVWSFRQTAPASADCNDPVVAPDHAYLDKPNLPVKVRVSDNVGVTRVKLTLDGREVTPQGKLAGGTVTLAPAGGWQPGLHRLRVEAWDQAGNRGERTIYVTHATKLVEKKWLPQGGVSIGGQPQFLLGMYGVLTEHLPEMQRAGYDFVHNYAWDGNGTNESALAFLDACREHKLQAFIGFNRAALQANDFDFVAERVGKLMAHPALLAWYLFDEPDLPHQYVPPDQLRGLYRLIRALDPSHPVIVTVAQRHMMPDYAGSYDVYWSMDYSTPAKNVVNFENHRAKLAPGVPLMSIVHCYDGKQRGEEADPAKFWPDVATMRAAAFMAIAHESSGLCWWWWGQGTSLFLTVAKVPAAWEGLKQTVADLNALKPVLAAQAPVRMWIERPAEGQEIHCWEKKLPDRRVIIAVNRDPQACEARIASPLLAAGPVPVRFEDRVVQAAQGALTDQFEPLGVHVYEWRP